MGKKELSNGDLLLLKEARDLLLLFSLMDKSGQAVELVNKIDAAHPEFNKSNG